MQSDVKHKGHEVAAQLAHVIHGQQKTIRLLLSVFFSGGHILLEDVPGTGKTTLAKAFARLFNLTFKRIQFTPDLLPSDILGVSIFDPQSNQFNLHKGPIFTDILLADELNRASPRTQSALLEAMAESQITLENNHFDLSEHFMVIATQNPIESRGTYPLPEAQMDRFALKLKLGYVDIEQEIAILKQQQQRLPLNQLLSCCTLPELQAIRQQVRNIRIHDNLYQYIVHLVHQTRNHPQVQLGASPRASLALMKTAQGLAYYDGVDFVTPDHILELVHSVLSHRLILEQSAQYAGITTTDVIDEIVKSTPCP